MCVWQGRLSASTQFTTSVSLLSRLRFTPSRPALLTSVTRLCQIYSKKKIAWEKKRAHLLSQPKNNTSANYFECAIHQHIVQTYWQHRVLFNQRRHVNWQRGFQTFETVPSDTSSSLSDGSINHPPGFEKDPLLIRKSFNWDVTGAFLVVGTHRDSISFFLPVHFSTRKLAKALLCLDAQHKPGGTFLI